MHEFNFIKMEGLGNDYIFVDMMQKNGIDETKITKVSVFKEIYLNVSAFIYSQNISPIDRYR